MKITRVSRTFFGLILLLVPAVLLSNHHFFYRSGPYCHQPRFDLDKLTTIDAWFMGGSTRHGFNGLSNDTDNGDAAHKVGLLNIYGYQDLSQVFQGVPKPFGLTPFQNTIVDLMNNNNLTNKGPLFGKLDYSGKFKVFQGALTLTQNLWYGFFVEEVFLFQQLNVTDVSYVDLTPPGEQDVVWQLFMENYPAILGAYNLSTGDSKRTTIGDGIIYGGWTYNCENCHALDFFDTTVRLGVSIPSAPRNRFTEAFNIPAGYNGHVGIPVTFDAALGAFDWFTLGVHAGGCFFLKSEGLAIRMKTNESQNGFIKLAFGDAKRKLGNIWDIGTYLKADHVVGGLSFLLGYTYATQDESTLTPVDTVTFPLALVNDDETLKKWKMHTIHVTMEYDFTKEGQSFNPHLNVFYNVPVAGKRIFKTQTYGGMLGANITWNF